MSQHIHTLISDARTSAGLSQAELARRTGIPRSVMNVYERGGRMPSADMFVRLMNAAGFELVPESHKPPTDPERAGRILEQVLGLAEALPYRPGRENNYPPLIHAVHG